MLVLTRKRGEKVFVGEDVTVTVVEIRKNSIRLGIEAPRGLNIVRGELEIQLEDEPDSADRESSAA